MKEINNDNNNVWEIKQSFKIQKTYSEYNKLSLY